MTKTCKILSSRKVESPAANCNPNSILTITTIQYSTISRQILTSELAILPIYSFSIPFTPTQMHHLFILPIPKSTLLSSTSQSLTMYSQALYPHKEHRVYNSRCYSIARDDFPQFLRYFDLAPKSLPINRVMSNKQRDSNRESNKQPDLNTNSRNSDLLVEESSTIYDSSGKKHLRIFQPTPKLPLCKFDNSREIGICPKGL